MTTLLVLVLLAVVAALVAATVRTVRHDRPVHIPQSHAGWGDPGLPSHPYAAGI